jgi:Transposase DDE domain
VIAVSSKLATARGLRPATAASSLGEVLGLGSCDEDDLYAAMDWLLPRQAKIEDALAARHLRDGTLVLYGVSSAAFEGRTCPLGEIGHARDGVRGRLQIVYGVLTTTAGIPVAVEVFKGATGDPATLASQVNKLKEHFGLSHVAVVGDRGMLTKARIRDDLKPAELDWSTALRGPAIKALISSGAIQPTLFDETSMAEITHPDYPGERLIACYNPFLAAERARKRGELLDATQAELQKLDQATRRARRPLRGKDKIALAIGKVIDNKKVAKHFITDIGDDGFTWRRDEQKINQEAALDGIYVIRTSLPAAVLGTGGAVESYKALANVERVFRGLNTDLLIRPIRHRLADRVRAHVLIRMLAYYVTWHMQQRLAPMLFKDHDPTEGKAARPSPVAPARRSASAVAKAAAKVTTDGGPVHSFATLLDDLATIAASRIQPAGGLPAFTLVTTPTPVQRQAFELLGVNHRLGYV